MTKVSCRYLSLSELPAETDVTAYHEFVSSLDLDLGLERNAEYLVIGIIERKGTPWLYVVPMDGDDELGIFPAALFSFDGAAAISTGMMVRKTKESQPSLEILPKSLATIDNWFERYVDDDAEVVDVIESEVKRIRQLF